MKIVCTAHEGIEVNQCESLGSETLENSVNEHIAAWAIWLARTPQDGIKHAAEDELIAEWEADSAVEAPGVLGVERCVA